ncbi:MAG: PaaI family thioesterase [Candidatus Binatia bacterium]
MARSRSWQMLQDLLHGGEIPPPRRLGVRMQLLHRSCTPGRWSGEILFDRDAANSMGIIHGGFLASILDIAMGHASLTLLEPNETQRTLELKINFLRGIPPDRVLAEGEVVRRGGRTIYCEGGVRTADGELVARSSATFYVRRWEEPEG